jgi:hypothetical protein
VDDDVASYMDNDVAAYVDDDVATYVDDDVATYVDDDVATDVDNDVATDMDVDFSAMSHLCSSLPQYIEWCSGKTSSRLRFESWGKQLFLSNKILWKETGLVACHLTGKKAGPMLLG